MSDPIVSHGRGGAGNIAHDEKAYTDGDIVREGPLGDQGNGPYSTGVCFPSLSLYLGSCTFECACFPAAYNRTAFVYLSLCFTLDIYTHTNYASLLLSLIARVSSLISPSSLYSHFYILNPKAFPLPHSSYPTNTPFPPPARRRRQHRLPKRKAHNQNPRRHRRRSRNSRKAR